MASEAHAVVEPINQYNQYNTNKKKVTHLLELPKTDTNLTLWKAELTVEGSFDEAVQGCQGILHVATPMDFESKDPENELIKPTVKGMLSIIESCAKANTVKSLHQKLFYDEPSWSDLDFLYAMKMTGWMYFVSKLLAEKAAMEEAKTNNINFISIILPPVVGPFITTTCAGNEAHYCIIKQGQYVHLDDLCKAQIFLYEHPKAEGRLICSSHHAIIYDVAKMERQKWPEYYAFDKDLPIVSFSSKKITNMGFQFKYSLEDITADNGQDKEAIPISTENYASGKENAPVANRTGKLINCEI
ncbi:unnamed protein product [Withania somnifera]